jgi:hypothetical protein
MTTMILIIMFILGFLYAKLVESVKQKLKNKRLLADGFNQFKEILENIKKGHAVFVSRVNQTIMIDTKLKKYDIVNIVYLMDKRIVCIFKENKCIYTSDIIDNELNDTIISNIHEQYGKEIDDVVEVLGVTISREELETKIKDFEIINKNINFDLNPFKKESSDIEKIIEENEERFEVDSILDKINKLGMEKITKEELEFLKTQSKK